MGVGDKITPSSANTAMTKIREMQAKWGLTQRSKTYAVGNTIPRTDASDLYTWLVEAKNKSKWTGTVPTSINVSTGTNITDVFSIASTTADTIKAYCACNCDYCKCNCDNCRCNSDSCCTDGSNGF